MEPHIQYVRTTDGVNIAYYVTGEGPPLVRALSFPSHLTAAWAMPGFADATRKLAGEHQLLTYDARGMGLSQRVLDFSLDTRVSDLRAVIRHLRFDRFALMATGHATMAAMAYAARHPDEVAHLVLVTPYADGAQLYETSSGLSAHAALESVTLEQWDFMAMTIASRVTRFEDVEAARALVKLIQASMSAEGFIAHRRETRRTSVIEELGAIAAPTMVIGRENDDLLPIELVQEVAARIPNARFQVTADNTTRVEYDELTTELILDFLRPPGAPKPARDAPSAPVSKQALPGGTAVILFTDIVDSTPLTERMGDAAFRTLSRGIDERVRAAIREHGGTPIEG